MSLLQTLRCLNRELTSAVPSLFDMTRRAIFEQVLQNVSEFGIRNTDWTRTVSICFSSLVEMFDTSYLMDLIGSDPYEEIKFGGITFKLFHLIVLWMFDACAGSVERITNRPFACSVLWCQTRITTKLRDVIHRVVPVLNRVTDTFEQKDAEAMRKMKDIVQSVQPFEFKQETDPGWLLNVFTASFKCNEDGAADVILDRIQNGFHTNSNFLVERRASKIKRPGWHRSSKPIMIVSALRVVCIIYDDERYVDVFIYPHSRSILAFAHKSIDGPEMFRFMLVLFEEASKSHKKITVQHPFKSVSEELKKVSEYIFPPDRFKLIDEMPKSDTYIFYEWVDQSASCSLPKFRCEIGFRDAYEIEWNHKKYYEFELKGFNLSRLLKETVPVRLELGPAPAAFSRDPQGSRPTQRVLRRR